MSLRLIKIGHADLPKWHDELVALERHSVYPLGDDAFRLDHGRDYFAFFARLGAVHYYAWEDEGRLVCVACGVLRPATARAPKRWYLADCKVHPDYRGRHLPIDMLRRAFVPNWLRCGRGYAIAMNPPGGGVPPAVRLLDHFQWIPSSLIHSAQLDIWSADVDGATRALPMLAGGARGKPHFVSLAGVKDLILESTRQPLALLHARYGAVTDERAFPTPQIGSVHMWCAPRDSATATALVRAGFTPSASATLVWHRLSGMDWSSVDTSEI